MPSPELMTWVESRKRWTRMYKGVRYWVSCKVLGMPKSKEGSLLAANAWWREQQARIDLEQLSSAEKRSALPGEDYLASGLGREDGRLTTDDVLFLRQLLSNERFGIYEQIAEAIENPPPPPDDEEIRPFSSIPPEERKRRAKEQRDKIAESERPRVIGEMIGRLVSDAFVNGTSLVDGLAARLLPPARQEQLRASVAGLRGESNTPKEKTVQAHAEAWFRFQQAAVQAKQMSAARCANNEFCLRHFLVYLDPLSDVADIDAGKLQGFYVYCLQKIAEQRADKSTGLAVATAHDVFSVAKAFIRWLAGAGEIGLPSNIGSKVFRFGGSTKKLNIWTPEEIKAALKLAPAGLRAAILLGLNCGFTASDVSDLRDEEVDWEAGSITKKRGKTQHCENVPTVCYTLWPTTLRALTECRSGKERVLLTEKQRLPYVRVDLVNGKLRKSDGFASVFIHVKKKLRAQFPSFRRSLKGLRKTAATFLEKHETYGRYKGHFLGHSPRTVADRHYAIPSQELFDAAVAWLGRQLGFVK